MIEALATTEDPRYDCLVISDLHLGSDMCNAKLLEEFLEWAPSHAKQLIINGDIFDDLNFNRLKKSHFACLRSIRRNSDRDDFSLIWMRGNHDGPADIVSHIVGVEILDEYIFENEKIRLLILHGDQFDTFITKFVWLTEISCAIFYFIQKYAPHRASRWIRRVTKKWQRNSQLIEQRAIEFARTRKCRYVTCGHTHLPLMSQKDGITYVNSGTWIESPPCPFVSVKGDEVRLQFWPPALPAPEAPLAEPASETLR
ncbi:MAG: hypothetical protein JWN86_976 [Planctomycetota bacterium]|nr:hypothetical protein [Planctomycetota bacterium]